MGPGQVWAGAENLAYTKIRSPDRPVRSKSLHRLRYSGLQNPVINSLTPNDHYSSRTAPLTSKRCILYIYSINIGTEYFEHGI